MSSITFSTCFYEIKSKFNVNVYKKWIENFLLHTSANVVVYTDQKSVRNLPKNLKNNILIVIKELNNFYNYKHKNNWIKNNDKNYLLKNISWELQMLWAEKVHFVYETSINNYFNTEWFGWCDIGYFRDSPVMTSWGKLIDTEKFSEDYIYYGNVNSDINYINYLKSLVNEKNCIGIPLNPIPNNQISVAGGFFICSKKNVMPWMNLFDCVLKKYFDNERLVKDDQIIIINCIFLNDNMFRLITSQNNWFMFIKLL